MVIKEENNKIQPMPSKSVAFNYKHLFDVILINIGRYILVFILGHMNINLKNILLMLKFISDLTVE